MTSRVRGAAHALLRAAVRGRRERGGEWGEAVLAEFGETRGRWEAVRWLLGGLRAVWLERRGRIRQLPRHIRIGRRVASVAVVGLLGGLVVNTFVVTVHYMPSGSMEPTLGVANRYLVDRIGHRLTGIHRGDVVEFTKVIEAGSAPRTFVKRVVGLPGDTIECRDGKVWRDGSPLDEPYLWGVAEEDRTECATVTLRRGELYVLGDHRLVSVDSREYGPIDEDSVRGRMLVRIHG
ncbi:signal peptidase I [Actinoplanes sp. NPDC049548]|uniref:signal peptidase I n=1 Tax=Actinoplanes sp. NPDC049548 TaxID=3155152 RepID=UPI00343EC05F